MDKERYGSQKGAGEEDVLIWRYIQLQTDKNISNS